MSQPRMSVEDRKNYLKKFFYKKQLDDDALQLENKIYRKSFFFIASWILRLLYILLFLISCFFYDESSGFQDEVVITKSVEKYLTGSKYKSYKGTMLHVETTQGDYSFGIDNIRTPDFSINDTIQIERNIFGRPIYFTKNNWRYKFPVNFNYFLYCIALIFTFMTLLLNDGNYFTIQMIKISLAVDIFAIVLFFFL